MTNTIDNAVQVGNNPNLPQIGDIVRKYCPTCEKETNMKYDGRAFAPEFVSRRPELDRIGQYTCLENPNETPHTQNFQDQ